MTTTDAARVLQALSDIAADMEADAAKFDGQPFNGRTVAEYFGNQGAAIAALANIIKEVIGVEGVRNQQVAELLRSILNHVSGGVALAHGP